MYTVIRTHTADRFNFSFGDGLLVSNNGPWAFARSGFSEVLHSFGEGGTGVLGLHGTGDPSSIGRDVSNGCIRMSNAGITKLADLLPLGTPVEITA